MSEEEREEGDKEKEGGEEVDGASVQSGNHPTKDGGKNKAEGLERLADSHNLSLHRFRSIDRDEVKRIRPGECGGKSPKQKKEGKEEKTWGEGHSEKAKRGESVSDDDQRAGVPPFDQEIVEVVPPKDPGDPHDHLPPVDLDRANLKLLQRIGTIPLESKTPSQDPKHIDEA